MYLPVILWAEGCKNQAEVSLLAIHTEKSEPESKAGKSHTAHNTIMAQGFLARMSAKDCFRRGSALAARLRCRLQLVPSCHVLPVCCIVGGQ